MKEPKALKSGCGYPSWQKLPLFEKNDTFGANQADTFDP
jgi:hypothetical protein